jgi:hypothetical protein
MKMNPQQLAEYPVAPIALLVKRASTLAPSTVVNLLDQLLTRMPPDCQKAMAAAIDSLIQDGGLDK